MQKKVILSGTFLTDINLINRSFVQNGYAITPELTSDTALLVIGEGARSYWATSSTGTLLHEAVRMQNSGSKIQILYESDLLNYFNRLKMYNFQS